MQVKRYRTPYGANEVRHRTVIETEPCVRDTQHSRIVRYELLKHVADDPFFSQCGGWDFQKAVIKHDGEKWVAEFEAIVPKPEST